ncbi:MULTISPECIES: TrmH family RNA methyltransferase [Flavobacterium]|uniref:tRNA (guanosine(18)-2'-O)-methyltransferase n=1 Tax=Flavobacterium lindanitolerans TaxID=428988 RepID=A0A497UCU3_9FLAO|nr:MULTISPECIES: RNA methyltransferase [Flavobacterium]MBU7569712.1 RNA methyltransferase [Flavobacterium sp.]KQS47655.1 rRNA methyltransferase [Flavobacterium sp. Leaf359]MBC8645056.1 RNA methyltransferase [Flavobacterium lindanitolerans]MBL7869032.1 RNA methyltransferase [Flavobacterium lindanitolerans]PKW30034.1 tRNA (guanosine-2'-O-)-methyltransferase [Flavobacterium lindanitolerans]
MKEKVWELDYLAYLEGFLTESRKEKFLKILEQRTNHFTIALEDVYQLHNTSAVMRSCEVFGIQNLHVVEEKYGKKIDKEIAMGAQKWVDVNRYNSNTECLKTLKEKGYQIIATTPHNDSCLLHEFDITKRSALFFGTERGGLSEEVMEEADGFLKIPMVGFTESLNISVSAAIVIQDITSRLRQSDVDWKLTEDEILSRRLAWAKNSIRDIKRIEQRYMEMNNISG